MLYHSVGSSSLAFLTAQMKLKSAEIKWPSNVRIMWLQARPQSTSLPSRLRETKATFRQSRKVKKLHSLKDSRLQMWRHAKWKSSLGRRQQSSARAIRFWSIDWLLFLRKSTKKNRNLRRLAFLLDWLRDLSDGLVEIHCCGNKNQLQLLAASHAVSRRSDLQFRVKSFSCWLD